MTKWNEGHGRVSRAFDEWRLVDADQRAFLRLGIEFSTREYDRLWNETGEKPYYEGGPELIDSFEAKVDNLHQHDFDWMLFAGVLRDAVTSFEVYLEKAREEVLVTRARRSLSNTSHRNGDRRSASSINSASRLRATR